MKCKKEETRDKVNTVSFVKEWARKWESSETASLDCV